MKALMGTKKYYLFINLLITIQLQITRCDSENTPG